MGSGLFCRCGAGIVFGESIHRHGKWWCSETCAQAHAADGQAERFFLSRRRGSGS